jgi:hippurate hydrolase
MLLGAARYLAETRNFDGTVHFIFQPAEENEGGGRVMVEQGLFEKFPVEAVYGMHNMPEIPVGQFGVLPGPVMASADNFEIAVVGKGVHAAMPYLGVDPIVVVANIVTALQSIASRNVHPLDGVVVSVTKINAGSFWNIIPDEVVMGGTARCFKPEVRDMVEAAIGRIANQVAAAYGASVKYRYMRRYPPTINTVPETEIAAATLDELVGPDKVQRRLKPTLAAEDFAYMLQAKPGCYIWIGNAERDDAHQLHTPHYDFNDEILPLGASYWARLVERTLAR